MRNNLKRKVEAIEKDAIIEALKECGWVQARAARMLGITERMIGYKIKKYGIAMKGVNEESDQGTAVSNQQKQQAEVCH